MLANLNSQSSRENMASLPSLVVLLLLSNAALCYCQSCNPSGYLTGTAGNCNQDNGAQCCQDGVQYPQYQCSPPVTGATSARMTLNDFSARGDGGGPSKCDENYHSNDEMIVALSTGWLDDRKRCGKEIRISANSNSVLATVVDECDSVNGCDKEHDFQPPCGKDTVDASRAVWKELEIPESQIGDYSVTWSDA